MYEASDILPKCKDMRNSYISPNWNDMRSIADMNELCEIVSKRLKTMGNIHFVKIWRSQNDY